MSVHSRNVGIYLFLRRKRLKKQEKERRSQERVETTPVSATLGNRQRL